MAKLIVNKDQIGIDKPFTEVIEEGLTICDLLIKHFPDGCDLITVSLNGKQLELPTFENKVMVDRGDEESLSTPLKHGDRVVFTNNVKGLEVAVAIISVVASVFVSALLPKPKPPNGVGDVNTSPNNTLQGQENSARLDQAIPDNYGEQPLFPDLANAEAYFEYDLNKANLLQYVVFGIGFYDIESGLLGDTPLSQIPGATETIVEPNPTTLETTINNYKTSFTVSQVEGQELQGTESTVFSIGEGSDVRFNRPSATDGSLTKLGVSPNFDQFLNVNDDVKFQNSQFKDDQTGFRYDLDYPNYKVQSVTADTLAIVQPELFNSNWTIIEVGTFETGTKGSFAVVGPSGVEKPVGPFDTGVAARGFLVDFTFPRGLIGIAEIRLDWVQVDYPGGPVTSGGLSDSVPLDYSANIASEQNYTHKVDTGAGNKIYFRVTMTRTNDASQDPATPTLVKWSRLAAWDEEATKVFKNVTIGIINIPQTPQALSPRENKYNAVATRKTISYNINTGQIITTLNASRKFADAVLHDYTEVFGKPSSELDLDSLYAIQESIDNNDPLLGEFTYTFDDKNVGLGARIETICNTARVSAFQDGDIWRFSRDEARSPSGIINRRDIAFNRDYAITFNPYIPSEGDGVRVEYVDPVENKKAYINRRVVSGSIVDDVPVNPENIQLTGCRNETQAINRAELEARRILYETLYLRDTWLGQGALYDNGAVIVYEDIYNKKVSGGEFLQINGNTSPSGIISTSERVILDPAKTYDMYWNGGFGQPIGPQQVGPVTGSEFQFQLITGDVIGAFIPNDPALQPNERTQYGSRYVIYERNGGEPVQFRLMNKTGSGRDNVNVELAVYDERIYDYD